MIALCEVVSLPIQSWYPRTENKLYEKLNFQKKQGSLTKIDNTLSDPSKCTGEKHDDSNMATNVKSITISMKSSTSFNDKHEITVGLKNFSYDIGSFYEDVSKLSDNEKYNIVKKVWRPSPDFAFPTTVLSQKKPKFNYQWLKKHSWLVYSKILDGAFCFPCVCSEAKVLQMAVNFTG